jgi:NADH-quinone oxidoreductase subunit G
MNIYVCVGSSCHLKGSYKIIQLMKEKLSEYNLTEKVNLSAAFCLGKCTEGVSIKIDDEIICGVSPENFDEIFNKYVLKVSEQLH